MKIQNLYLPDKLLFIMKAMRLHRPVGTFLLFWPSLWGILIASRLYNTDVLYLSFIMLSGSLIMRSAGCVINEYIDKDYDKHVQRTKNRPFAKGNIGFWEFCITTCMLLMCAALLLPLLNSHCITLAFLAVLICFIYPFMKRITLFPQTFLGLVMNYGLFIGYSSASNLSLLHFPSEIWFIFVSAFFWTIGYDTVYALQDARYDKMLGLGSTAVYFRKNPQIFVGFCYLITLIFSCVVVSFDHAFSVVCFGLWALSLGYQVFKMRDASQYDFLFHMNIISGLFLSLALVKL